MDLLCTACLAGPTGIEGHSELRVLSLDAAHIAFKCRRCDMSWRRPYASGSGGRYAWTTAARGRAGLVVPSSHGSVALPGVACPTSYPTWQWLGLLRQRARPRPIADGPMPAVPVLAPPKPSLCVSEQTLSAP